MQITWWNQAYNEPLDRYDPVWLEYEIENTGNASWYYYKVYFKVTCKDSSTYYEWDEGLYVDPNQTFRDVNGISTEGKKAISVTIEDQEYTKNDPYQAQNSKKWLGLFGGMP